MTVVNMLSLQMLLMRNSSRTINGEFILYEQLTDAQKRILFNGAQLNNAYVIEMMG